MTVRLTGKSLADLLAIRDFISTDHPETGNRYITELFDAVDARLRIFPRLGRIVPESSDETYREIIYGNFRIIYKLVDETEVTILTVRHSKQLFLGSELL